MRLLIAALALTLATASALANDVYRTVQPDGTVVYSDRPLSPASQLVSVASRPTDPEQVQAEAEAIEQATAARRQAATETDQFAEAREEQRALMDQACEEARRAAAAYEGAPRLYEELPGGGRRYLAEEEIVEARMSARRAVADFCRDD